MKHPFFCVAVIKTGACRQNVLAFHSVEFHEDPTGRSRGVSYKQVDTLIDLKQMGACVTFV